MVYRAYNLRGMPRQFDWGEEYILPLGGNGSGMKFNYVFLERDFQNGEYVFLRKIRAHDTLSIEGYTRNAEPLGWLAKLSACGRANSKGYGVISIPSVRMKNCRIYSYGIARSGDEYGSWVEVLVAVPFRTVIKIDPVGMPTYFLVFTEVSVERFTSISSVREVLQEHAGYSCGALVRKPGWEKTWQRAHLAG